MSSKKTTIRKVIRSGTKTEMRKMIPTKEEQYQIQEHLNTAQIKNDFLQNIDKFNDKEKMEFISSLRFSIDKKLDAFEHKIQTEMSPEEKKAKYRHLFGEDGYGTISKTSGIYYVDPEGTEEQDEIAEIHIDNVDWKNVIGTISHYGYGEILQVLDRRSVFDFFSDSNWETRRKIKEWIKDQLAYVEDFQRNISSEVRDNILRERIRIIEDNINDYKKIGYADEIKVEEEIVIALRKKYNIWR